MIGSPVPRRAFAAFLAAVAAFAGLLATGPAFAQTGEPDFRVYFEFGKTEVTPAAGEGLALFVGRLKTSDYSRVVLSGRADSDGSDAQNVAMSRRRAEAVAAHLEGLGVPRAKMALTWLGEGALARPTGDGVREPDNRVVEITIEWE
jgi:OOP family OmpA-OmpF porin